MDMIWLGKVIGWTARSLRWIHGERIIYTIRDKATVGLLKPLHLEVIHLMRRLALEMKTLNPSELEAGQAGQLAMQFCTECRELMGTLLELQPNELHCCLKVLTDEPGDGDDVRVATWVRSQPVDDRPIETGPANAHSVSENSVWAALFGRSDGKYTWRPFDCFVCNDLPKHHPHRFRCDRANWEVYYKSTLVFPLRYAKDAAHTSWKTIGFLAFDSPKTGAFKGFPDIFEYQDNLTTYRDMLDLCATFHLGAVIADTLSTFLRKHYEQKIVAHLEGENNGGGE